MSTQYVKSKETKKHEKEEKFGAIGRWRILHQIKKMLTFPKIPTLVQTHVDLTLRSAMQVVQIRRGNMCLNLLGAFLGRGMPSCPVHLFCLALNIFVVSNDFLHNTWRAGFRLVTLAESALPPRAVSGRSLCRAFELYNKFPPLLLGRVKSCSGLVEYAE